MCSGYAGKCLYSGCHARFCLKFYYILQYVQSLKSQSVENRTDETKSGFNRTVRKIYRFRSAVVFYVLCALVSQCLSDVFNKII